MDIKPSAIHAHGLVKGLQNLLDSLDEATSHSFKQFLERLKDERLGILDGEKGGDEETKEASGAST